MKIVQNLRVFFLFFHLVSMQLYLLQHALVVVVFEIERIDVTERVRDLGGGAAYVGADAETRAASLHDVANRAARVGH